MLHHDMTPIDPYIHLARRPPAPQASAASNGAAISPSMTQRFPHHHQSDSALMTRPPFGQPADALSPVPFDRLTTGYVSPAVTGTDLPLLPPARRDYRLAVHERRARLRDNFAGTLGAAVLLDGSPPPPPPSLQPAHRATRPTPRPAAAAAACSTATADDAAPFYLGNFGPRPMPPPNARIPRGRRLEVDDDRGAHPPTAAAVPHNSRGRFVERELHSDYDEVARRRRRAAAEMAEYERKQLHDLHTRRRQEHELDVK
ncbi:hypothetical protein HK405_014119, partial [Cladochytrium tenue]